MPADDVSDLKDVFDAINKLCETMKTSNYDEAPQYVVCRDGFVSPGEVTVRTVDIYNGSAVRSPESERSEADCSVRSQFVSAEDLSVQRMETQRQKWRESQASLASSEVSAQRDALPEDRWSDTQASPPGPEPACPESPPGLADVETVTCDTEPAVAQCEPVSDLYYTASSDVSLASESELPEKQPEADKECAVAGHVAAMRERFESMTRANTPCPDTGRPPSPAPDTDLIL